MLPNTPHHPPPTKKEKTIRERYWVLIVTTGDGKWFKEFVISRSMVHAPFWGHLLTANIFAPQVPLKVSILIYNPESFLGSSEMIKFQV